MAVQHTRLVASQQHEPLFLSLDDTVCEKTKPSPQTLFPMVNWNRSSNPCSANTVSGIGQAAQPNQAMRKIYRELMDGYEGGVDADLRDFFGTVHHELLINMIAEQNQRGENSQFSQTNARSRVYGRWTEYETPSGIPQGSVGSRLFSNFYLNRFDHEMTEGTSLTRFADDWVVLCKTQVEAGKVLRDARTILESLGLTLLREKVKRQSKMSN